MKFSAKRCSSLDYIVCFSMRSLLRMLKEKNTMNGAGTNKHTENFKRKTRNGNWRYTLLDRIVLGEHFFFFFYILTELRQRAKLCYSDKWTGWQQKKTSVKKYSFLHQYQPNEKKKEKKRIYLNKSEGCSALLSAHSNRFMFDITIFLDEYTNWTDDQWSESIAISKWNRSTLKIQCYIIWLHFGGPQTKKKPIWIFLKYLLSPLLPSSHSLFVIIHLVQWIVR